MREAFCLADSGIGLATDITILSMLALSAWLVLRTGRISLGQQAFFALGAYLGGAGTAMAQWPLALALLAAMAVGALAAALVAALTARLGGLHYAVASLAFAELVRLGLSAWHWRVTLPGGAQVGPQGIDGFRDIRWLLEHRVTDAHYLGLALAVLALLLTGLALLGRLRLGTLLQAIGHDDTLATASGLPVARLRVAAAALAGAIAALAGGLYAHRVTSVDPAVFDPMLGVHAVGYALIGGLATPLGPLLGAGFDLGLLEAARWFEGWRMVVFGGLVALFLRWRPRGLLDESTLDHLRARWLRLRAWPRAARPSSPTLAS